MRVDLLIRYRWYIRTPDGRLEDPEGYIDSDKRMLYTYPTRKEALAGLSQYIDIWGMPSSEFVLTETFGLE